MADEADLAVENEATILALQLTVRKPVPPFTGRCLNCDAEIAVGRYCDGECREEHEKRERIYAATRPTS
jgi:hypothetical protein